MRTHTECAEVHRHSKSIVRYVVQCSNIAKINNTYTGGGHAAQVHARALIPVHRHADLAQLPGAPGVGLLSFYSLDGTEAPVERHRA